MPYTGAGPHPLDRPFGQRAGFSAGIGIGHVASKECGEGRDPRMRVGRKPSTLNVVGLEQVQKHEGLQALPQVARAHQAGNEPMAVASGPVDYCASVEMKQA